MTSQPTQSPNSGLAAVPAQADVPSAIEKAAEKMPAYAYYSPAVLTVATFFNFLDRMILSILARDIRTELGLDDVQLGFLLGTGFAVFYAVVGIAMGRNRRCREPHRADGNWLCYLGGHDCARWCCS